MRFGPSASYSITELRHLWRRHALLLADPYAGDIERKVASDFEKALLYTNRPIDEVDKKRIREAAAQMVRDLTFMVGEDFIRALERGRLH